MAILYRQLKQIKKIAYLCLAPLLAVIFLYTSYNQQTSPDAQAYLLAAQTFLSSPTQFLFSDKYCNWPPLFPVFVALNFLWGKWVSITSVGLLGLIWVWGSKNQKINFQFLLASVAVFWGIPWMYALNFIWSELLFIPLLTAHYFYSTNNNKHNHYMVILILSLLVLTRNSGFIFIISYIIFSPKNKKNIILLGITIMLGATWWLRNYLVCGTPTGYGTPNNPSHLLLGITTTLQQLGYCLLPQIIISPYWAMVAGAFFSFYGIFTQPISPFKLSAILFLLTPTIGFWLLSTDLPDYRLLLPFYMLSVLGISKKLNTENKIFNLIDTVLLGLIAFRIALHIIKLYF